MTFLIGNKKRAVGIEANTVGGAKPIRQNFGGRSIGRNFQQRSMLRNNRLFGMTRTLGIVEIAFIIRLQPGSKFVKVLGNLVIAIEVLIPIGFAITIQVVQGNNLIAANDVRHSLDYFDA